MDCVNGSSLPRWRKRQDNQSANEGKKRCNERRGWEGYDMPGDELYCYPGGDVLKNKLNITDDELLHDVERKLTAIRIDELLRRRVRSSFDFEHLKAILFFIFRIYTPGRDSRGKSTLPRASCSATQCSSTIWRRKYSPV